MVQIALRIVLKLIWPLKVLDDDKAEKSSASWTLHVVIGHIHNNGSPMI
jgi:hypothetical protein